MRAPLPVIALAVLVALAGCTIVDDTRPAVGGVTGPADPTTYLKPVAKPTPATKDVGLRPMDGASAAPAAPAPTPVAVEADPAAPSGAEPEVDGEDAEAPDDEGEE